MISAAGMDIIWKYVRVLKGTPYLLTTHRIKKELSICYIYINIYIYVYIYIKINIYIYIYKYTDI